MIDYLRDPAAIYAASFATIRRESDFSHLPAEAEPLAVRIVHACGMTDVAKDLLVSRDFIPAARQALHAHAAILVDAEMVRQGILPRLLKSNEIICTLNYPQARELGITNNTTRSAAAVSLWRERLHGSLVVIGNAPTALFALLEHLAAGAPKPAAIAAFPVGFVGAVESKAELVRESFGIPYFTLLGRRGGSAMAAAVVNALLDNP